MRSPAAHVVGVHKCTAQPAPQVSTVTATLPACARQNPRIDKFKKRDCSTKDTGSANNEPHNIAQPKLSSVPSNTNATTPILATKMAIAGTTAT